MMRNTLKLPDALTKTTMLLAFLMLLSVNLVMVDEANAQDRRTHVVRQGETLFSISRQYEVTVDQIRSWNNLSGNQINLGQRLFVSAPGSAGTQQRPAQQPVPRPAPTPTQTQAPTPPPTIESSGDEEKVTITHRVGSGETLFSLSRRYGVSVNDIKEWNNLSSELVEIGQSLRIQTKRQVIAGDVTPSADESSSVIASSRTTSAYYTVRAGDTLTKIASDNSISVEDVRNLNRLQSDRLSVGQVLLVRRPQGLPSVASGSATTTPQGRFISYEVRRGERLVDILRKFEMTESEFVALNADIDLADIRQGLAISVLMPPGTTYKNPYRVGEANQTATTSETIRATRYNDIDRGRSTTNGDLYNPSTFTAAHNTLPLGSVVYLENSTSGVGLFVLINDRIVEQSIKLSQAAFDALGFNASSENSVIVK